MGLQSFIILMKDSTETNLSPLEAWCHAEPRPLMASSQKDTAASTDCLDDQHDFES